MVCKLELHSNQGRIGLIYSPCSFIDMLRNVTIFDITLNDWELFYHNAILAKRSKLYNVKIWVFPPVFELPVVNWMDKTLLFLAMLYGETGATLLLWPSYKFYTIRLG